LNLRRAESAQRGLVLTGQAPYREEFREAAANTPAAIQNVRNAIADNPARIAQLDKVIPLVRQKLEEMEQELQRFDEGRTEQALDRVRAGTGRELMDSIRDQILVMYNGERELLDARRAESRRTNAYLLAATLTGAAVILLIGALSIYLVQRSSRQREEA